MHAKATHVTVETGEFLAFKVNTEQYGIAIGLVQELRGYDHVTRIANAPACVKGVINLRGAIVSLIDLRILLGNAAPAYDATTVVVILCFEDRTVGLVVDGVSDVVALATGDIAPAPALAGTMLSDSALGFGMHDGQMLLLLDAGRLLSDLSSALLPVPEAEITEDA